MTVLSPMLGGAGAAGAPARPEEELLAFPLSPGQHRMWLANKEWPGNPAYNASFRWTLEGPLDLSALQRSFNEIIARHEVLRTTFGTVDGLVHQLVQPSLMLLIPVTDLRSAPPDAVADRIEQICAAEAERSFNLERGPLIRVGLLRVEDERYILMLTLHHIICDGWSIGVIMRELQQVYSADVQGHPSPLPPLPIQFSDYVIWRGNQDAELRSRDLDYWKNVLHGYRRFRLPPDLPETSDRSIDSAIVSRLLPREVTERLKGAINRHSGTMFTLTFAAFLVMLKRRSGATDLAIGTPLASRDRSEIEGLIGLFVNPAVLRVDLAGDPSFIDLAAKVRDALWDAIAHQSVAFETVIDALPIADRPQSGPFYAVNFICQRAFGGSVNSEFDFSGIDVTPMPSRSPGTLFDLNVFLIERDSGWRVSFEYKTERYSGAMAHDLLDEFCRIVEEVSWHPEKRLSQLLEPEQPVAPERPETRPAPALAKPSEDAPGLAPPQAAAPEPEATETFELPASASQFRFWRLSRIWPDSPAFNMPAALRISGPLSAGDLERALQAVVDRHEILRTTFKELDGELHQLVVSRAEIVLQRSDLRDAAAGQVQLSDLIAEEARRLFDLEHGPLLRAHLVDVGADDHVLIVCMHHIISDGWSQSILQRELWTIYDACTRAPTLELTPLPIQYADFAVWQNEWLTSEQAVEHLDYWMTTLNGSLPVLDFPTDHPPGQRQSVRGAVQSQRIDEGLVERLKTRAQSANVTMFMLTVSAFAVLLERFTGQHQLVIGAPSANRSTQTEPLIGPFSGPIALRLDLAGDSTFGEVLKRVSQVTMDALDHAVYPFERIMERLKMRSVQGRNPLFQFYFLYQTAFLQPREVGDLLVSPMPTPSFGNPFELQLAIIERHDGVFANLEYNQGLFEPASIQNVMTYFLSVLEAIAADADQKIAALKPPRIAQRTPTSAGERAAKPYVGPRTATEVKLAAMWSQLFELPKVSVCDDFFDLGGHSLMAASLMSLIEREFGGTKVDLSNLLLNRTIEQLGRLIDGGHADSLESSLVSLRATGSRIPLFCVHGGGGHVLAYQALAEALPDDQPVHGLAAPELDGAQKAMSVCELASLYNQEIKRVQAHGPYRLCGYSFGGMVALEMAAQLVAEGEVVEFIVMLDTANSGYYRNLPWGSWIRFWTTRVLDRIHRYYRRFADHKANIALSSASYFVRKNIHERFWSISRRLFQIANRPMPVLLRDNVTMFKTTARGYQPAPVPSKIILFRVAERDPEYNHNPSLGWELIARNGVSVHYVPGDHLSFMRQPHVKRVAEQLVTYLV